MSKAPPPKVRKEHHRKNPTERKAELLAAGYAIAKESGLKAVTRLAVGAATDTTDCLVNRYFKGRAGLRTEILEHAVSLKDVDTLAWAAAIEGFELPKVMPRQLTRDVAKRVAEYIAETEAEAEPA